MKLYSENKDYKLYQGSMLDMLEVIEPNTIDSVVCDPPYELNFMGKGWDNSGIAFQPDTWKKCYEVLKPGGYLLAFGGSRTFHRIACAIEDAGFEIRDTIMWIYGSGFPKSMDISKQIDKRPNRSYENLNLFGKKLKEQRELKGYSKNDIDKMMGTNTAYAWWEGRNYLGEFKIQLPDKDNYKKLKEILELTDDMDFIFEEVEREVIGTKKGVGCFTNDEHYTVGGTKANDYDITIPSTDLAKQWQGWGTALKPSFEPIIVARKPFKGSLVDNIIENGVGGINIDECRVKAEEMKPCKRGSGVFSETANGKITGWNKDDYNGDYQPNNLGRFPANTILTYDETDFNEVCGGFPNTKSQIGARGGQGFHNCLGRPDRERKDGNKLSGFNDSGSASRYFYAAKASKKDRDEGLDEFEEVDGGSYQFRQDGSLDGKIPVRKNTHPTVKPTTLMQYLVRLVTPNGGTILDPFNGSGSTGKAVMYENKERNKNYKYIGIELTEEYLPIAKARIEYVCNLKQEDDKEKQMTIFDIGDE
jgi:DNA modification methylase